MNLARIDKLLFLPVAFIGCLICAFPVLIVIPTTEIRYALTGTVNLFLADGIIAWLIIAGIFGLISMCRCFHIGYRLRPLQAIHAIYCVLTLFQIVAYTMVVTGPFSRLDFFLNNSPI